MSQVVAKNISKTFYNLHTLDDVSIHVKENEFVVLLGPSGCGKSTLFHIIAGLTKPDRGEVFIDGENWTGRTGRVGYMQQKDLLLPSKNILANVAVPLLLKGISSKEAYPMAKKYFKVFGLEGFENHYPGQLSGGMKQRAALLRTFLFAQDILLLDEPFASLDAINRRKMHLWLKDLRKEYNSSILYVTHDIDEALLLADRIYVLSARPAAVKSEINMENYPDEKDQLELKKKIIAMLE